MFIVSSGSQRAIAPGFLKKYTGKIMLSSYFRYEKLMPIYIAIQSIIFLAAIIQTPLASNKTTIAIFSAFMFLQSARLLGRQLVLVNFSDPNIEFCSPPIMARIDQLLGGGILALVGARYQLMTGEFDGILFKAIGWAMIATSVPWILSAINFSKRDRST